MLLEANEQAIVVKSTTKKLKLESISPAQWIAANSRIMAELIRQSKLPGSQMLLLPELYGQDWKPGTQVQLVLCPIL